LAPNYKSQAPNYKQIPMTEIQNTKQYDLEERTARFAEVRRNFVRKLSKNTTNFEDGKQLVRS